MEITRFDIKMLTASVAALAIMSFMFPALGMTGDNIGENEIPDFNISQSRFDFAGDFPERPDPSKGSLFLDFGENLVQNPDQRDFLHGDTESGVSVLLTTTDQENATVTMTQHDASHSEQIELTAIGQRKQIENSTAGYNVHFVFESISNSGTSNVTMTVDYEVIERPEDQSFLGSVPLLGSIVSGTEAAAQSVLWLGAVLFWGIGTFFELVLNLFGIMFDGITFFIGILNFIGTEYANLISGAPSAWVSVALAIPGLNIAAVFGKFVIIAVDVLWIG